MDEKKPEDELKPDPSDRRPVRSRNSADYDNDPQINVDDIDVDDEDDRRPGRSRRAREEREVDLGQEELLDEELQDDDADEEDAEPAVERRPRKRKKAPSNPASRQRLMMGVGILVLLLLIVGIGAALKTPSSDADSATAQNNKNIDLAAHNEGAATPVDQTAANTAPAQNPQDVTLPPISSQPTEGQAQPAPAGQQRVEVQGDLNTALTQPDGQQINNAASSATLPTQPATVASVSGQRHQPVKAVEPAPVSRQEPRRKVVLDEPRKAQPVQSTAKNTVEPKPVAKAAPAQTVKAPAAPKAEATTTAPKAAETTAAKAAAATAATAAAATAPKATTTAPAATTAAPAATAAVSSTGNVNALKSAPANHYTLQLSSSSNYTNLNAWAKKENLQNFVVYQTVRNGQPWYVLVSGVYASKDDAKHAVSALPADVQAKNPWAKPLHQVQSDLKQ